MRRSRTVWPVVFLGILILSVLVISPAAAHYAGIIYYPPAVDGDDLYVSGTDGVLYALTAEGELRWSYNVSAELTTPATIANESVVAGTATGRVVAVHRSNGTSSWATYLRTGERSRIGFVSTEGGTIYATTDQAVHSVSLQNGSERWTFNPDGRIIESPEADDHGVYVVASAANGTGTMYALSSAGSVRWTKTFNDDIGSPTVGPDGTVYFETNETLYALSPTGAERWSVVVGEVGATDVSRSVVVGTFDGQIIAVREGTVNWTYDAGAAVAPTIGPEGTVYAVMPESVLAIRDGRQLWETEIGVTVVLPPAVGSYIYVGTQVNRTYALSPDGSIAWINQYETNLGDVPWSTSGTEPPAFLAEARGTPTRMISKHTNATPASDGITIVEPTAVNVALGIGVMIVTLLFVRRRYGD